MSWFEVDKDGLRQLLEGRDKSFVLRELIQNAWDEPGVTICEVSIAPLDGRRAAALDVSDDAPEGFYDLRHAYTLYANTRKRSNPTARGRFNLGEKQVLSLCENAEILTTTGGVRFKKDGTRSNLRRTTETGSIFSAVLPMTRKEILDAVNAVRTFLPPVRIETRINGKQVPYRAPVAIIPTRLQTEFEDETGQYRTTVRKTEIRVVEVRPGEKAMIYEMGLPIIETGDRWHYDIAQRVPMTADRDNVRPAFLQDVRAEVASVMVDEIPADNASETWVREAMEDDRISDDAFEKIVTKRWGKKRAVADPNDPHSKERAIAGGYTIVPPRALSKKEWARARETGSIVSTGQIFPTKYEESESIPRKEWSEDMERLARLTRVVAEKGAGLKVDVGFVTSKADAGATYGFRTVTYNLSRLGKRFLKPDNLRAQLRLIIHEIAHEWGNHIESGYYDGLAKIGAKLALIDPKEFEV